ncbi:Rieske (2Fe-2S) protein [Chamaesiphon sp. OTE_8_metabat_110]|uniref:QcrA and Rieske domain-containing protein n=1 Tax=Chamaesiphon sp. OTE_8_metabat_110 TaxID=2964696 RepID=UPI00286A7AD8|nr:Rieske (2Fe-2S) protein [Chamaesiphon sp. OTE_8_metabat_110]
MIKRRSFIGYFSVGWLTTCFPIVLAAYDPDKSSAQTTADADPLVSGNKDSAKPVAKKTTDGFTVVGSVSELEKTGYLQTTSVAVTRNPTNPNKLIAVNPKCTHQGCDVKWVTGENRYTCPCHSSNFEANGEVINGPATKPLAAYPAKIVGTQVLVKIVAPPPVNPNQKTPSGRGRRS